MSRAQSRSYTGRPPDAPGLGALIGVAVHAWLVLAFIGVTAWAWGGQVVGANIGAVLWTYALAGIGLPWSLVDLLDVWPNHGGTSAEIAFYASCAVLNLVLHATVSTIVTIARLRRHRHLQVGVT